MSSAGSRSWQDAGQPAPACWSATSLSRSSCPGATWLFPGASSRSGCGDGSGRPGKNGCVTSRVAGPSRRGLGAAAITSSAARKKPLRGSPGGRQLSATMAGDQSAMADFVHLHLHSQYSLLDGANRLDDVIGAAAGAGMPAMALTDHGNMFGAIQFYNLARKAGVKPILGIEAYVAQGSRFDRTPGKGGSNHLVLLAANETGYRNLIKLTSQAYLEGFYYKPRGDKELLRQHSEGIIALSACLKGEINERIVGRQEKEAEATAREFDEIFGRGNFFLEMQDPGIPEQRLANEVLRRIAGRTGQPMVVTNDCHYLRQDDAFAHDVLLCIGTQRSLSDTDRLRYASEHFYLKSAEEMHRLFPDDHAALENTLAIAERCNVVIPTGTFHLPEFPVPAGYTRQSYFAEVARAGLAERLIEIRRRRAQGLVKSPDERYAERLEVEVPGLEGDGPEGFFPVVGVFIRYAREQGIPVGPGRGSAAGWGVFSG